MAGLPCTDPHIQALSGFAVLNDSGQGAERARYYGMVDLYTGQLIVEAVLAALIARKKSPKPQYVEMTMLGAAGSVLMASLTAALLGLLVFVPKFLPRLHELAEWLGIS